MAALLLLVLPGRAQPEPGRPTTAVLRANVARATTPATRAKSLLVLSWELMEQGQNYDSSRVCIGQGMRLARQAGDSALVAEASEQFGECYLLTGDLSQAQAWVRRAMSEQRYLKPELRVRLLDNLGQIQLAEGQPEAAIQSERQALQAVTTAPATKQGFLHAQVAFSLGKTFFLTAQLDSAVTWIRRARLLYHQTGDAQAETRVLNQEALVYLRQGHLSTAAHYLRQVLARQRTLHDEAALPVVLVALGNVAAKQDSSRLALFYLRTALGIARRIGQAGALPQVFVNMGTAFRVGHQPDSAEYYYRRAIAGQRAIAGEENTVAMHLAAGKFYQLQRRWPEMAQQAQAVLTVGPAADLNQQADAYALLLAEAEHRRDYAAAYRFLTQENALRDTLRQHDSRRLAEDLRVRYETAQAEQQVQLLTQRNHLQTQQQELARLRYQRQLAELGGGALLALAALGGGLALYRRRQRRREATLRTRLAADLHDDVGALLTQLAFDTAVLQGQPATSADQHTRLTRMAGASQQAVRQLREVVWSVDSRHDSFASLLDRLRDYAHEVLPPAGVEVDFHATPELYERQLPPSARQALYLIYKEALHNLVKHARATEATIRLAPAGTSLGLTVDDDGPTAPGPTQPQHHGLDNMRRRAQEQGGRVAYEANPAGPGWRVRLTLPLG